MPCSSPYAFSTIAGLARQLQPSTVLDVGVGFGKYGFLFREYLDIWDASDTGGCHRERWKTRIDGIDVTPEYITPLQEYLYDTIYIGDALDVIDTLGHYDVVVMGDVLEHFEKSRGFVLLDKLYAHAGHCVVLAFPPDCQAREAKFSNPAEAHRSQWRRGDFGRFPQVGYRVIEGSTAVVALTKPPHPPPLISPSFAGRQRTGWKGLASAALVGVFGQRNASRLVSRMFGETIHLTG